MTGIYVHEALAGILSTGNVEEALMAATTAYAAEVAQRGVSGIEDVEFLIREQTGLLEGLVRGWVAIRLPRLLEEFEVVSVEEEFEWEIAPGLIQMLRMDVILRHKIEKTLFILEFKTVANPGYAWQQQWERNIQFMSYTQALKEHSGEEVGGVMVEGLVKGSRKLETAASSPFNGRTLQNSPFCYAYRTSVDGNPFYSPKWHAGKGWTKVALPEETLSIKEWTEIMDPDVLREQFVTVPPISPLKEQIARWRRQVIAAESRFQVGLDEVKAATEILDHMRENADAETIARWQHKVEETMDFYFPQHDNHCLRYGSPCSFSEVCFNDLVGEDPLGSGLYTRRTPHHATEVDG